MKPLHTPHTRARERHGTRPVGGCGKHAELDSGRDIRFIEELDAALETHWFYGRGTGVGRGFDVGGILGVGVDLGVAVGVDVAVAVGVGLALGVAVGVAVDVGVGVGLGVTVGVGVPPAGGIGALIQGITSLFT